MSHEERILRIEDWIDGTLAEEELADFERHLAECAECRAELDACRRLRELGGADDPVPVPDGLDAAIRRRLAAVPGFAPAPRRGVLRILPYFAGAVAAAAAVLLVVLPSPTPVPGGAGGEPAGDGLVAYRASPAETAETLDLAGLDGGDVVPALSDWLVQAGNAATADAPHLVAEARDLALLPRVRAAIPKARGPERDWLRAGADLLVQLENDMAPDRLAPEARAVRRRR